MTSSSSLYPVFNYTEQNFHPIVRKDDDQTSKFDELIVKKWTEAEENNVLRYKLNINNCKRVDGNYGFLAQLNFDRAKNRRQPEHIQSMKMPFNPDRFNFTKINNREIFFDVGVGDGNNVVAANVSPMEFGHCVVLPHRLECLPQVATESSLLKITELLLLSKSPHLRAVFNSLCAHASVNHLHWHLYYLKHEMLLEHIDLRQLSDKLYMIEKKDYPATAFCLKLSTFNNNVRYFANVGFKILNYLQSHEIAHNVYITRAKQSPLNDDDLYDDLRIYIWPRNYNTGVKDTSGFIPGSSEFFGHLNVRSEEFYNDLTQTKIEEILKDAVSNTFNKVVNNIMKLTNENTENSHVTMTT
ncbi:GDP-D-glucose phosphorylase 1 [Diachasma alloeum]|uniref:GDP-D-glucose phosphorylase 1 n=1 Tax=Diachasma alloeum TaxID=454923 RepID=UPI0007383E82|nr:GDP-D-glucose phosphorylase 1 [Diachasma alloeum]